MLAYGLGYWCAYMDIDKHKLQTFKMQKYQKVKTININTDHWYKLFHKWSEHITTISRAGLGDNYTTEEW